MDPVRPIAQKDDSQIFSEMTLKGIAKQSTKIAALTTTIILIVVLRNGGFQRLSERFGLLTILVITVLFVFGIFAIMLFYFILGHLVQFGMERFGGSGSLISTYAIVVRYPGLIGTTKLVSLHGISEWAVAFVYYFAVFLMVILFGTGIGVLSLLF